MMPARGYLLCCVERTGSNLLAEALAGTGIAGRPVEYFNPVEQNSPWIREILGESRLVDGISKILMAGTTPNGMFGAKTHWNHFRFLGMEISGEWNEEQRTAMHHTLRSQSPQLLSEQLVDDLLLPRFSDLRAHAAAYSFLKSRLPEMRFIWLQRNNMIARAISHYRARQTGLWHKTASSSPADPDSGAYRFDVAEIHTLNRIGHFQQEMWRRFFEQHDISPLIVVYEELAANYEMTVRSVLEYLCFESREISIGEPVGVRQSDALSQEWEQRYRKWSTEAGL